MNRQVKTSVCELWPFRMLLIVLRREDLLGKGGATRRHMGNNWLCLLFLEMGSHQDAQATHKFLLSEDSSTSAPRIAGTAQHHTRLENSLLCL